MRTNRDILIRPRRFGYILFRPRVMLIPISGILHIFDSALPASPFLSLTSVTQRVACRRSV